MKPPPTDLLGTWQDPELVSNDRRADNVLLEVGSVKSRTADRRRIVRTLSLINNLNQRADPVCPHDQCEQTTLIS
jgi:hypothetical protein